MEKLRTGLGNSRPQPLDMKKKCPPEEDGGDGKTCMAEPECAEGVCTVYKRSLGNCALLDWLSQPQDQADRYDEGEICVAALVGVGADSVLEITAV